MSTNEGIKHARRPGLDRANFLTVEDIVEGAAASAALKADWTLSTPQWLAFLKELSRALAPHIIAPEPRRPTNT